MLLDRIFIAPLLSTASHHRRHRVSHTSIMESATNVLHFISSYVLSSLEFHRLTAIKCRHKCRHKKSGMLLSCLTHLKRRKRERNLDYFSRKRLHEPPTNADIDNPTQNSSQTRYRTVIGEPFVLLLFAIISVRESWHASGRGVCEKTIFSPLADWQERQNRDRGWNRARWSEAPAFCASHASLLD